MCRRYACGGRPRAILAPISVHGCRAPSCMIVQSARTSGARDQSRPFRWLPRTRRLRVHWACMPWQAGSSTRPYCEAHAPRLRAPMSPCEGASRPCTTHEAVQLASCPSTRTDGCREQGSLPAHGMYELHVRGEQRRGPEGSKGCWHTCKPLEATSESSRGWNARLLSHAHGALRLPAAAD